MPTSSVPTACSGIGMFSHPERRLDRMFLTPRGLGVSALLFALALSVVAALTPVAAEEIDYYEGEPTDPERIVADLKSREDEIINQGITLTPPAEASALDSWYDALLDALRSLGII